MTDNVLKPVVKYSMTCQTNVLKECMKFLSVAVPRDKKGRLYNCEITVKTNEVNFVVIGATKTVYCDATGPVKISLPFWYFNDIVKRIENRYVTIDISDGFLTIGKLSISTETCFFQDDSILRSIKLPINYTLSDIFSIANYYTPEELAFNKIDVLIKNNLGKVHQDITKIAVILEKYGISKKAIARFIFEAITIKPQMQTNHE